MSEDRVEGADAPKDTPAVARAQVGRASVTGSTAGDQAGLGVLPSRQPAEGRTYRAGDYGTPAEGSPATLKPAEGSITPAPVLSFTTPPAESPGFADFSGDRPAGAGPSSGEPSADASAGSAGGGGSAWSNFAMPKRETADASLNAAVATAQSEPAPIRDSAESAAAATSSPAAVSPPALSSPAAGPSPAALLPESAASAPAVSTPAVSAPDVSAPAVSAPVSAGAGSAAYGGSAMATTSPGAASSPSTASPLGVQSAAWPNSLAFGDAEPESVAPAGTYSAPVSAPPVSSPPVSSPVYGSASVSAPPVSGGAPVSAPPAFGGAPVSAPPVTSGPPAFRAASSTSYGRPAATPAAVQPDYTLPDPAPAAVQPDYSLPAQRSGTATPAEPTRARASVPGLNRITPGASGVVGSASSGTEYPRVYRAGAPGATEPDPVEPPDPAEPPAPPEPPRPAEPPAPGPGPMPTPFPDPNRPGPTPGPQPGPPVPMPPAPPTPPPGPPFPSPSPVPPFPPPPAVGTTWSSASATATPGRADVPAASLPPWPASEVAQPGRQWPPRDEAPVTPVVRGLSPDSSDDPHGVAASAEYNQWARGQRRESGTVYSPPARTSEPVSRGVPANPAIENTGSLTGHILSPQRWNDNSDSHNSTRVMVILASVAIVIIVVGVIASIVVGDQLRDLFGQ